MMKPGRNKNIVKGLLLVVFAFAVVSARIWLFPDNEVLEYIALFIGAFLIGRASRVLEEFWVASDRNEQEVN